MKSTILLVIISLLSVAICDPRSPAYYWSEHFQSYIECFCSGVTNQCHAGSFNRQKMTIDFKEIRGFLEWPNRTVSEPLQYYYGGWEMAYIFNGNEADGAFIWEVPFKYHGNRTRMYGGLLKFNHKITPLNDRREVDPPVYLHILSNEVNISYTVPKPEGDNSYSNTRTIILSEKEAYIRNHYPQRATKADVMRALMSAYKILIEIGRDSNKFYIILNSPALYVAVDEPTSDDYKADWIEVCDCPKGYAGESCESCAREFWETCEDVEQCERECGNSRDCYFDCHRCHPHMAYYHRNINDKSRSVFGACEEI